jgi:hypothetical protein
VRCFIIIIERLQARQGLETREQRYYKWKQDAIILFPLIFM